MMSLFVFVSEDTSYIRVLKYILYNEKKKKVQYRTCIRVMHRYIILCNKTFKRNYTNNYYSFVFIV